MNKLQESRFDMYIAVRDFLLKNTELTKGLPNFDANFTGLQETIEKIQAIAEEQKENMKGFAKEKHEIRAKLLTLVLDNSEKLHAYATFSNNVKLQESVKMTKSKLDRARFAGLKDYAQIIYDKAESNIDALISYGITKETQAEMGEYISRYNAALSGPKVATTDTVQATKNLSFLFEHADLLLDAITIAIGIIKIAQPVFLSGFKSATTISNAGNRYVALKAVAVDNKSGKAIKGAKFLLRPLDVTLTNGEIAAEIVKTTKAKGIFYIKNMPEGTYAVTVSKPGYKSKVASVVIANNEMTVLNVELEAA